MIVTCYIVLMTIMMAITIIIIITTMIMIIMTTIVMTSPPKRYVEPRGKNLQNTMMHLTNYAINCENPDFEDRLARCGM